MLALVCSKCIDGKVNQILSNSVKYGMPTFGVVFFLILGCCYTDTSGMRAPYIYFFNAKVEFMITSTNFVLVYYRMARIIIKKG